MANKIVWDETTKRFYETGIYRGVLYPIDTILGTYPMGVAWNGLTAVTEAPAGAEATKLYADNKVYLNMVSAETFGLTIEAYTYPVEFGLCDGSEAPIAGVVLGQQGRKAFGLAYRTVLGNDAEGNDYGYKLHLVYGCLAAPSERPYATINDSPEALTFSWELSTTPVALASYHDVSILPLASTTADATKLAALEVILYGVAGTPGTDARLPLPDEIITLMTPA